MPKTPKSVKSIAFQKAIVVTVTKEGYHSFKNAPEEVKFLRDLHRHLFEIRAVLPETEDRSLEFFIVQEYLSSLCDEVFALDCSCEEYAEKLAAKLLDKYDVSNCEVTVFEEAGMGAAVNAFKLKTPVTFKVKSQENGKNT